MAKKVTNKGGKVKGTSLPKGTPKFNNPKSAKAEQDKLIAQAMMMGQTPQMPTLPKDTNIPDKKKKKKKVR